MTLYIHIYDSTKITATEDDGSQKGIQYICIHIAIYI